MFGIVVWAGVTSTVIEIIALADIVIALKSVTPIADFLDVVFEVAVMAGMIKDPFITEIGDREVGSNTLGTISIASDFSV